MSQEIKGLAGWSVYLGADAGSPDLHVADRWYYQPDDYDGGEVYARSAGYVSREEAEAAARKDSATLAGEAATRAQEAV